MPEWVLGQNIIRAIKENFNSQRNCLEDFQIDNPLQATSPKMKKEDQRSNVKWKAPLRGWIKGNFDGVSKGNPGKASYGGVLRDHNGNIIDAIAIPIGISTSHKAEATVALYTMRLAMDTSNWYLWMEGDSLNIINMLNGKSLITWSIEASVMEIKTLMDKFEKVIFSHSYCEGNVVADWIAKGF